MVAKKDSLGRRSRMHPQSTGKGIVLQPRDLLWMEKLQKHGPLPSSFLLAFCKDTHKNEKRSKERLTHLYNENNTADRGSYLSRPSQQARTIDSRYKQLVYDLTKTGRKALEREQPDALAGYNTRGPWIHKLMVSCITASIDLACADRDDVNYISGPAILERAGEEMKCPLTITYPTNPTPVVSNLIPDALFGLEYLSDAGSTFRFFAVEADRSTEPAVSKNWNRKSFVKSLLQYRAYVEDGEYKTHLGLSAPMMVLNVTNSNARVKKMRKVTTKHFPAGNSYMLFAAWEDFGEVFRPPFPKPDLMDGPWKRAGLESLVIAPD